MSDPEPVDDTVPPGSDCATCSYGKCFPVGAPDTVDKPLCEGGHILSEDTPETHEPDCGDACTIGPVAALGPEVVSYDSKNITHELLVGADPAQAWRSNEVKEDKRAWLLEELKNLSDRCQQHGLHAEVEVGWGRELRADVVVMEARP